MKRVSYTVQRGLGGPRKERKRIEKVKKLNVTSLIDILTILLVFLIKNVSMEAQKTTPPEGMNLVEGYKDDKMNEKGNVIVIKVFPDQILFGVDNVLVGSPEDFATDQETRSLLLNLLKAQAAEIKANDNEEPILLIQADRDIECLYITEFVKLSAASTFNNIYFSTMKVSNREAWLRS